MAMNNFVPNSITKAYIQKVDEKVLVLRRHIERARNFLGYIFDDQFFENEWVLETGCRVWVRWLNDTDLEVETNQQFVKGDSSREGQRGIKFWQLLGSDNILPLNGNPPSSTDALKYFSLLGPKGILVAKVLNFFDTEGISDETKQNGYNEIVKEVTDIITIFDEFLKVYQEEYSKQFPKVFTPPVENNNAAPVSGLSNSQSSQTPVNSAFLGVDFKNPLTWLVIAVIVFGIKKLFFSQNNNFVPA